MIQFPLEGLGAWKQYSFVRGADHKTVRRSGTTVLNSTSAPSSSRTGGAFFIGSADGRDTATSTNHHGYMTELIMFPKDFTVAQLAPVESNQIRFWGL